MVRATRISSSLVEEDNGVGSNMGGNESTTDTGLRRKGNWFSRNQGPPKKKKSSKDNSHFIHALLDFIYIYLYYCL